MLAPAADPVQEYLQLARRRGFRDEILRAFDRADKLRIAFVGEQIFDQYLYVSPLAKPSKEFILAAVKAQNGEVFSDTFAGGVIAASLHGDWPNKSVVTSEKDPIWKMRFVDVDFNRKIFEVYSHTVVESNVEFKRQLSYVTLNSDVVIVLDFGHGLIGEKEREILRNHTFLAVNAQTNAGNFGFNPVTKYNGLADYICLDEPEARLAVRCQNETIAEVLGRLRKLCRCNRICLTRGRYGSLIDDGLLIPAFATGGIDTMGAGDAFLAVSAPLVAASLDLEMAAFVGNIAGAIKVGIVGHRSHVTRSDILAKLDELLT